MQDIRDKRQRTYRSVDWSAYREQRRHLASIFPASIAKSGQAKRPLAHGIRADLIGANVGLSEADIANFLRGYTYGPKYLRALRIDVPRCGLDGTTAGTVGGQEARYASLCLRVHYDQPQRRRSARQIGLSAVRQALVTELRDVA